MKVLLYNFQQPDENSLNPGGVGVYLRSIASEFSRRGIKVVCLSAGDNYDERIYANSVDITENGGFTRVRVMNSPVIAPSHANFFAQDIFLESDGLDWIAGHLHRKLGHIDVFHFHNIEGLTWRFFAALRREFPGSKILMTAHNYNIVCPQVNLWQNEKRNCRDFRDGKACVTCTPFVDAEYQKRWRAAERHRFLSKRKDPAAMARYFDKNFLPSDGYHRRFWEDLPQKQLDTASMSARFREFREKNAAMCGSFDTILATSARTKHVLGTKGLSDANIEVCYIGSNAVLAMDRARRTTDFDGLLHIAYFGYARRDKGFFFLVEALKSAPKDLCAKLELTIAAKGVTHEVVEDLGELELGGLRLYYGYDAPMFAELTSQVHLGIVPHLWEDNLPQVAIELVAAGVPVLVSDLGGASEIASNPKFQFAGGSVTSFLDALEAIATKRVRLADFWGREPNVRTMEAHVDELLRTYYC